MPIIRHGYAQQARNGSTRAYRKARAQILNAAIACSCCGQLPTHDDPLEADHRLPHADGGSDHPSNLRPVLRSCNRRRGRGGV